MAWNVTLRAEAYKEDPTSCLEWTFEGICDLYERVTNLINLFRKKELLGPVSRCYNPTNLVTRFRFGAGSQGHDWSIISEPAVMGPLLAHPRNGDLFETVTENNKLLLFLEKCFEEQLEPNDFIIFCNPEYSAFYHRIFGSFLGAKQVNRYFSKIEQMTNDLLASLPSGKVNISALLKTHITSLTAATLLDYSGSEDDPTFFEKLVDALDFVNAYAVKNETQSKEEEAQLATSVLCFREVINQIAVMTHSPDSLVGYMQQLVNENKMSLLQMKLMIFVTFFGGYQTTTYLSIYTTFQLAKAPEEQTKLLECIHESRKQDLVSLLKIKQIRNIMSESLRLFPSGYFGFREPKDVVGIEMIYSEFGEVMKEEHINLRKKDHQALMTGHFFAGRDQKKYPEPDRFNPNRFNSISGKLTWLPFGSGPNRCPGEWFARSELKIWLMKFVQTFDFKTDLESITVEGRSSLMIKEDVILDVTRRATSAESFSSKED